MTVSIHTTATRGETDVRIDEGLTCRSSRIEPLVRLDGEDHRSVTAFHGLHASDGEGPGSAAGVELTIRCIG